MSALMSHQTRPMLITGSNTVNMLCRYHVRCMSDGALDMLGEYFSSCVHFIVPLGVLSGVIFDAAPNTLVSTNVKVHIYKFSECPIWCTSDISVNTPQHSLQPYWVS
jgi:hypothetical protein